MKGEEFNERQKEILSYITDFVTNLSLFYEKEKIIKKILSVAIEVTGCDSSSMLLLKDNEEKIAYDFYRNDSELRKHKSTARLDTGISGRVINDREIVVLEDTGKISDINPEIHEKGRKAIIAVPIIIKDEVEGILYINYLRYRPDKDFAEYSKIWLQLFSAIASSAIYDARLYQDLHKAIDELKISFEISRSLIEPLSLNELINRIFDQITNYFGYENIGLFVIDESREYAVLKFASDPVKDLIGTKLKVGEEGIVGKVASDGETYYSQDVTGDEYYREGRFGALSELSIPMKVKNKIIGVLDIESAKKNDFPEDSRNLLISVAANIAIAIERARLYEKTKKLSRQDPLTEVANRRRIEEELKREVSRANRYDLNFSILFIDLDNFKDYNDRYGHFEGDKLLVSCAELIDNNLREEDIFGRYGGDEFIAILHLANKESAGEVAKRILRKLEDSGSPDYLSLSIGIAVFPVDGENYEKLISSADEACYIAKSEGGNIYKFYS